MKEAWIFMCAFVYNIQLNSKMIAIISISKPPPLVRQLTLRDGDLWRLFCKYPTEAKKIARWAEHCWCRKQSMVIYRLPIRTCCSLEK